MANDRKLTEVDIFDKWKKTQDPMFFQELYKSLKPLIHGAAEKASLGSNVPLSAHKAYAAQNFLDALRTFQPGKGASLQTHIYGAVHQKAKRLNYQYQNLGSIPEPRAQTIGVYQNEHSNLRDALGREPSAAELADKLGWGIKEVANIQKEMRRDLSMTEGMEETPYYQSSRDEELLNYLYYDLGPEEKVVYEYVFGKNGKQKMIKPNNTIDFDRIGGAMGISSSRARAHFIKIRTKLESALKK